MNAEREKDLLKLLLFAYPDRVTVRRVNDSSRGVMVGGRGVVLEPGSLVRTSPLFLSIDPRDAASGSGVGTESRVALASAIEAEWLEAVHPHLIRRQVVHRFDPEREKVASVRETRFVDLPVREDAVGPRADLEGASRVLCEVVTKDAAGFFAADERAESLLRRLRFLRHAMSEVDLPAFDQSALEAILAAACEGCVSVEQVRRKNLVHLLESRLSWRQREALREHAPEFIEVPSGSRIRLQYPDEQGGAPVLAVRLQELFGWKDSPRVADGRVALVLHLLGPNFRPVQVTSDLKSFWATTYGEVRKDLRARYPKHPWPENPWSASPKAVGGKRKH